MFEAVTFTCACTLAFVSTQGTSVHELFCMYYSIIITIDTANGQHIFHVLLKR